VIWSELASYDNLCASFTRKEFRSTYYCFGNLHGLFNSS